MEVGRMKGMEREAEKAEECLRRPKGSALWNPTSGGGGWGWWRFPAGLPGNRGNGTGQGHCPQGGR